MDWRSAFAPVVSRETGSAHFSDYEVTVVAQSRINIVDVLTLGTDIPSRDEIAGGVALSRTGVLRVLFELSSRCSVELRGFGEVEVEGKIKANWRLLEAIVCTLFFELMPSGRGRRTRQIFVFVAGHAMATRRWLHLRRRAATSSV